MHATSDDAAGTSLVAECERALRAAIAAAAGRGWRLDDLHHALPRLLRGDARDLARDLERPLGAWQERRGLGEAEVVRAARSVGARITALPALAAVRDQPAGSAADAAVLEKVRALLAKAESTAYPAEADALNAKAHELMSRHAIDAALVAGRRADGEVQVRRVLIAEPYAQAKVLMLATVARSCRCEVVWSKAFALATVFGFTAELEAVELLYSSLLVQSTSAMLATPLHPGLAPARVGAFRRAFLYAFAQRVGERLREAAAATHAAATADHGDAVLVPVLAERAAAVEAAVRAHAGRGRSRAISTSDRSGWAAGAAAGDRATLAHQAPLPRSRRSLSA